MEENIANTRRIYKNREGNRHQMIEVEELLAHIVQTTGRGTKLPLELVEHIVQQRTGCNLATLVDCPDEDVLTYMESNLSPQSDLIISLEDRSLAVKCEELTLDCCVEVEDSLEKVKKNIKLLCNVTTLDLSRRCLSSTELLEVCQSARMLKFLIIRDVQIQPSGKESSQFSLLERIKWYCPALEAVDITGCSQAVCDAIFQTGRTLGVQVVDLLATKPEVKELLICSRTTSDVSNANRIKALVQDGIPADISYDGWSFLHAASVIGDADLVSWLLERNANFKFRLVNGNRPTALEMAIRCHNVPIVKQLLHVTDHVDPVKLVEICFHSKLEADKHNTDSNHREGCNLLKVVELVIEGRSPEFKAAFLVEVVKVVQRKPPRTFREETQCCTETFLAELFKALISLGCSPDIPIKDLGGKTPLMCTVWSPVLVETLLNLGANQDAVDEAGNTALFYAVSEASEETAVEHFKAAKILIEFNANTNCLNKYGETPLLFDASNERLKDDVKGFFKGCNLNIWELLVESGADISATNKDRRSVMHLVVDRTKRFLEEIQSSSAAEELSNFTQSAVDHCTEQIKFVSSHNNRLVKSRDCMGNTPLHLLARINSPCTHEMLTIAEALVKLGSNVNAANDREKTPLHLAKSWGIAKFLLEKDAKPNNADEMGCTPLLCRIKDATIEGPLSEWSEGLVFDMDPWQEDSRGQNVFQVLIESAEFEALKHFIDATMKKDREAILRTDSVGNTVLHYLCNKNDSSVLPLVEHVLRSGANVNAKDCNGDTALHIACRNISRLPLRKGFNSAYRKVISKLRVYGAKCTLKNNNNVTPRAIVWLNKKLLSALDKDVRQLEPDPIFRWISQSQNHQTALSRVARGQDFRKIDSYCYHVQPIGSGSFSNVYAAINVLDGREVALKRIEFARLKTRQDDREINSLLHLSNGHQIVRYINFIRETDFTWIVIELMEGTLNDLLKQGIPQDSLTVLSNDVMRGVEYLHNNNILHRDLKPGNVLYTNVPRLLLKIGDFGLSKKLGGGQGSSVLHSNAGTRFWMAPELLLSTGRLQHTFASDMFSCGLVLHFMLANGHHPFEGSTSDGPSSIAEWNAVETNITTGIITLSPDLSDEGKDLLEQVLSDKDDRPNASEALKHPFFWSDDKKITFLCAVANQSEIGIFGRTLPSLVELEIEHNLGSMLHAHWDSIFPALYVEMTSSARGRRYDTSSGVHLVRFIRNCYAHVSDRTRPTGFQNDLLTNRVFLRTLPNLFMTVFKAVKKGNWDTSRAEIRSVING